MTIPSSVRTQHCGEGPAPEPAATDDRTETASAARLPAPAESGIEHVVVVMLENRSFDHFLGWLPGADGEQAGLRFAGRDQQWHQTYPLAPDFQGCGYSMPDHSTAAGMTAYNHGACDGWLRVGSNDLYAIGYYTQSDLPFLGQAAITWTSCDRYFAAIMSETIPNRLYLHAAQTDRITDTLWPTNLPTIWDRLARQGLSGRYYFSDVPMLALWGLKYRHIVHRVETFLADCREGRLPAVAFVDPHFLFENLGTSNDDHPFADIRNGEVFLNQIYQAVTTAPTWPSTVLIITFDEWGGFFDHVPPKEAPDADPSHMLRGFRVPCLLISPWSRRGLVDHTTFDHTSILKLIEWRWGLAALTPRDAAANNLAAALDFGQQRLDAPVFDVPLGPFGSPCPGTGSAIQKSLFSLRLLGERAIRALGKRV